MPSSSLNKYDRATAAEQLLVDNLPQLKRVEQGDPALVPNIGNESSQINEQNKGENKVMPSNVPNQEASQPPSAMVTMTSQQMNDFVLPIIQNVNLGSKGSNQFKKAGFAHKTLDAFYLTIARKMK